MTLCFGPKPRNCQYSGSNTASLKHDRQNDIFWINIASIVG